MRKVKINKVAKIIIKNMMATCLFLSSVPAVSAIPYHNAYDRMDLIITESKELNISLLEKIQAIVNQNQFSMSNYVPANSLTPSDDSNTIAKKILNKTLQTLLDSEGTKNSQFVQQAAAVNSLYSSSIDRNGYQFSFRLKTLETKAEVKFKGVVEAVLSYDINHSEAKFEVTKQVGVQTLAFTHVNNHDEISNAVGVRWSF